MVRSGSFIEVVSMGLFSDVSFVLALERSGPKPDYHAIIRLAAIAVDTLDWSVKDQVDYKIKFVLDRADDSHLTRTSYDETLWDREGVTPQTAANEFSAWCNRHSNRKRQANGSGKEFAVWRMIGWDVGKDQFWLSKWYERLGVKFSPIANGDELNVRDRVRWYFVENPALTAPQRFDLESVANYFHLAKGYEDEENYFWDARNIAELTLRIGRTVAGAE